MYVLVAPSSLIDCIQKFCDGSFYVVAWVFVYCLFTVGTRVDSNSPYVAVPATATVWTLELLIKFWKFLVSSWKYLSQPWIFCSCDYWRIHQTLWGLHDHSTCLFLYELVILTCVLGKTLQVLVSLIFNIFKFVSVKFHVVLFGPLEDWIEASL